MPVHLNNDISLHCVGFVPISVEISYRKLQFLGQLCRLPCKYLAKCIFVNRLIRYNNCLERQSLGFIPDVYSLLNKYRLTDYINTYIET